jgi:hypothetical protein
MWASGLRIAIQVVFQQQWVRLIAALHYTALHYTTLHYTSRHDTTHTRLDSSQGAGW